MLVIWTSILISVLTRVNNVIKKPNELMFCRRYFLSAQLLT